MHWWRRLLPVFALAALLAMHGLDAESTDAHIGESPLRLVVHDVTVAAHPMSDEHLTSHLAGACIAMLLVAFAAVVRLLRAVSGRSRDARPIGSPVLELVALGLPPPVPRYALAVIRH